MTEEQIINAIKAQRIDKKLSQNDLALLITTSKAEISKLEAGKKTITLTSLLRICKAIDLTITIS